MTERRELVSQYWGDHDTTDRLTRIHWMASPVVRAYLNRLASGDATVDWLTWVWRRRVLRQLPGRRPLAVLVLGCGTGWLERSLAGQRRVGAIDACDVSAGAVAVAAETARRQGLAERIRYHVVDLNREAPPSPAAGGGYDVVVAHSVLHHVEELEFAYPRLVEALVRGGLLVMNEYVGPSRFQFTDAQMAVVNAVLARLPERLRMSLIQGVPFPHKVVPTVDEMIAVDPSESVRSAELLDLTRRHFEVLDEVPYGGTVLQHLLYDVVQNFDPASLAESRLLALVCLLEEALIREGELPSDYAVVVARRPAGGAPRRGGARTPVGPPGGASPGPVPRALPVGALVAGPPGRGAAPPRPGPGIHTRPFRRLRHGLDLAPLTRHLHRLATGDPACDWLTWVLGQVVAGRPAGRALVVEEPPAWMELAVAAAPEVDAIDRLLPVFDRGRLRFAFRPAAAAPGPALALADLRLPATAYRYVFSDGWIGLAGHPLGSARRQFAGRLAAALAPGGLLVGDEWLGPPDGRTAPRTLRYARRLAALLADPGAPNAGSGGWQQELRAALVDLQHGVWRARLGPPSPLLAELLGRGMALLVERPTGGALLQRVLATAGERLATASEVDMAFLEVACYLEERLTGAGAIESEYVCFVAEKVG